LQGAVLAGDKPPLRAAPAGAHCANRN